MWSSQQTLVTFSLQSRPTLKVLMSGSKSDQSFLSELYIKKLILLWILALILTWWCLVYTEDSPRLSRQWNVSTPQTRTDTALNWPCPVWRENQKVQGGRTACCLLSTWEKHSEEKSPGPRRRDWSSGPSFWRTKRGGWRWWLLWLLRAFCCDCSNLPAEDATVWALPTVMTCLAGWCNNERLALVLQQTYHLITETDNIINIWQITLFSLAMTWELSWQNVSL